MGTWNSPSTIDNLNALAAILKEGPLAANVAIAKTESYIGDDRMHETIDFLITLGEGEADVRSLVADFLGRMQSKLENDPLMFKMSRNTARQMDLGRSFRSEMIFEEGLPEHLAKIRADLEASIVIRIDEEEVYERFRAFSENFQLATLH